MWSVILYVIVIVASWKVYVKMGRQGWECIVPFYNVFVLFQSLYGNGWKMFLLLIPFYNIYVMIKLWIDLAKAFGEGVGFALGLLFVNPVFMAILGFGNDTFTAPTGSAAV
jgi:hypothetical protein